jgi:hypothetical protein
MCVPVVDSSAFGDITQQKMGMLGNHLIQRARGFMSFQGEMFPLRIMSRAKQISLAFGLQFHRFGMTRKRQQDEKKDAAIMSICAYTKKEDRPRVAAITWERDYGCD